MQNIKEQIKKYILSDTGKVRTATVKNDAAWLEKHNPELLIAINELQPFDIVMSRKIYNIMNDIKTVTPGCDECGVETKFISYNQGYSKYCKKCGCARPMSPHSKEKFSKTKLTHNKEYLQSFYDKTVNISREEICKFIDNFDITKIKSVHLIKNNLIFSAIINQTLFIPYDATSFRHLRIPERFWCISHNLMSVQKCSCGKNLTFLNSVKGYRLTCKSRNCKNDMTGQTKVAATGKKITKKLSDSDFAIISDYIGKDCLTQVSCPAGHIFEHRFINGSHFDIHCPVCEPYISKSKPEYEINEWLSNLKINVLQSHRIYKNDNKRNFSEIDIFLPAYNFGIEYDGLYWHSESHGKGKQYHLEKTNLAASQNIQLVHIFENEWIDKQKQQIWKSLILAKLGMNERIYARKCSIVNLPSNVVTKFLNENHLQGACNSSVNIGLYHGDQLVCVLTFAKSRFNKKYVWEITRFANKLEINVIGGFSRLLANFRKNYTGSIITYADKRYSVGNLYKQTGFTELKDSAPNYWYWKDTTRIHSRVAFQKHKLLHLLDIFDPNLTEAENMRINGWNRIWDCGNKVFCLI